MTTGEKLHLLRDQKRMTSQQVVEAISAKYRLHKPLTHDMYRNWESDRNEFTWEHGLALASFYHVTLDELVNPKMRVQKLIDKKPVKKTSLTIRKGKMVVS